MNRARSTRLSIAILLGLGVLINYFDRVNLSVAHDALQNSFGISDVTFGYLLSAYSWTYAAMQLPSGVLLDRFGVRKVMLAAILLWGIASGLTTVAPTILFLFAARFLLGIGEAPTFPANAKAVGLWFEESKRAVPTATFDSAAKLSVGLGTPILGLILLHFGMRANFATTTILSFAYGILFFFVYRDPKPGEAIHSEVAAEIQAHKVRLLDLLRQPKILGVALGSGAYNYCFYLLLTWLPVYLQKGLKMSSHNAVLWTAVPWLTAAAAEFLIGGLLLDALVRRGNNANRTRRIVLIGGTAFGLFVLAPAFLHQAHAVLICLSIALSGMSIAAPVLWTMPSLLAPPGGTGRTGAIMNQSNQLAAIVAPIVTGYLSTWDHSFRSAFLVAGIVLLAGIASYIFLLGRIERVQLPNIDDGLIA